MGEPPIGEIGTNGGVERGVMLGKRAGGGGVSAGARGGSAGDAAIAGATGAAGALAAAVSLTGSAGGMVNPLGANPLGTATGGASAAMSAPARGADGTDAPNDGNVGEGDAGIAAAGTAGVTGALEAERIGASLPSVGVPAIGVGEAPAAANGRAGVNLDAFTAPSEDGVTEMGSVPPEMEITPPQTEQRARTPVAGTFAGSTRKTERHSGQETVIVSILRSHA